MKIRVYHNISHDAGFGLNRVFDATDPGLARGVRHSARSHELVRVFEYDSNDLTAEWTGITDPVQYVLNVSYLLFNREPETRLARAYRARKLRSLSKGDVLQVGDRFYACESFGWARVDPAELAIVGDPDEAERLVRERYDFGPDDVLALTVPWTGEEG